MKKIIPILLIAGASCNQPTSDEKKEVSKKDSTSSTEKHKHHHGHGHGNANEYMHEKSFDELVANFESQDRIDYQQPDKVLEYLGNLKGKKVMDIGAGTGFFSFRMVEKGAEVIAADVNEDFQKYISKKKDSLKISDDKLSLRKLPYDSPELKNEEVDMVIIVNTYHHIENRQDYFLKVKNGLKKGGRLVIIDFKKEETPVGPPVEMKLSPDEIMAELKACGLGKTKLSEDLLEYQYIIEFAPLK
jgi:ubiquinone/menaquinone biosynthesis C-methylase UbiE